MKLAKLDRQICDWIVPNPVPYSLDIFRGVLDVFNDFEWETIGHEGWFSGLLATIILARALVKPPTPSPDKWEMGSFK